MATGTLADFVIYEDQFFGGVNEVLAQNADVFNAASNDCIRLVPQLLKGQYDQQSFFKSIPSLVTRRDPTSVAAGTSTKLVQGETVGVKLARRFQVENTLDSFKKIQMDAGAMSVAVGEQVGVGIAVDYVNTGLLSIQAAIPVDATHEITAAVSNLMQTTYLVQGLALFGDRASRLRCWVMHSKVFFDLFDFQMGTPSANIFDLSGELMIRGGNPGTLGRPVVVTDSADLIISGSPDRYITLGLVPDALRISESEERSVVGETVTGLENLVARIQGEHSMNIRCLGHSWNISGGGANPDDTALAVVTNWTEEATDLKDTAGIRITTE